MELASCLSFVVIFRLFFKPVPTTAAREMAWSQMGSGALLPGGGVGSLAVGGWLLHLAGMSAQQILRRSSGLFFLTSAINVFALAAAGLLLLLGIGPTALTTCCARGCPSLAAAGGDHRSSSALPSVTRRVSSKHPRPAWLEDIGTGIPAARHALARPNWRLLGAVATCCLTSRCCGPRSPPSARSPPLAPLVVAYLAGYLANAIPIPGGIGILDSGLVGALALYGLPVTHAAAAVLVYHAIAFWIPTLGGMLGLRPAAAAPGRHRGAGDRPSAPP